MIATVDKQRAHGPRLEPGSVSQRGALAQSFAIGPIFGVGFLSGTVAVFAGFNTPLSILLAGAGTLGLAAVLAMYARRFAGAGAVYEYLTRGTHPSVGIVGAGTYLLGLMFLGAGGGFVGEGYLLNRLLASELSVDLGWWVWALVALVAAIALNWTGVRIGVRAIMLTTGLSVVPFIVIAVAVIVQGGANGNSIGVFDPGQTSPSAVLHGILFAIALFIGFETVAALGEEARTPRRTIPVAMIASIVVCAGFYVLTTYAGAIGFGKDALAHNAWYAAGNPFGALGQRYVGPPLRWIVNLTIVLDLFSVCVAFTLAASRVLMTLARDRLLPVALARTSRRFRTPVGGLTAIAVWSAIAIAWTSVSDYGASTHVPNVLQALLILSATGSYLVTLVYLLLAIGALWLLRSERNRATWWWKIPVVLVAIAIPGMSFDGSLNPLPAYPNDIAAYLAGAATCVAILWYAALRLWRAPSVGAAAHNADQSPLLSENVELSGDITSPGGG